MGEEKTDGKFNEMELFEVAMARKWAKVVEIYQKYPEAHTALLTRSKETALHIAISSFHSTCPRTGSDASCIEQMMGILTKKEKLMEVVKMENLRGDTLLHLSAAVGSDHICHLLVTNHSIMREELLVLLKKRNARGETPLFVAAHHGNLHTFLSLSEAYDRITANEQNNPSLSKAYDRIAANERNKLEPLRRSEDGDTVLHSAISGEYFDLAYQIMKKYPLLIQFVNANGESPLYRLARKPNVFKSSSHLRLYDSIIYKCVFVDELKLRKYKPKPDTRDSDSLKPYLPSNYMTCGHILYLPWSLFSLITGLKSSNKESGNPIDEENPQTKLTRVGSSNKEISGVSKEEENQQKKTNEEESINNRGFFPANYATCILLFKFAMKIALIILGIGFGKIKKIKVKKERYHYAMKIMNEMITQERILRYGSTSSISSGGQKPDKQMSDSPIDFDLHNLPDDDDSVVDNNKDSEADKERPNADKERPNGAFEKKKKEKPNGKDSPLLVAAKTGILEMVKKILKEFPVAMHDNDSKGKNALMVAAEYRQSTVFDYLMKENLPEYMFHQFDYHQNGILHLAAKLEKGHPWRIPGAALQMQWEIKWYKHVKKSVSAFNLRHENSKGETPRTIFDSTHEDLVKAGNEWLIKTSESCSVIAALIAGVAFATSATVPGGLHQDKGYPNLKDHKAFDVFAIASLIALCLSVTALVFFVSIITSRCEVRDFKSKLPKKLLMGLSSLFASIIAMLLSFCAGHTFILREKLKLAAIPIYAFATIPIVFFAIAQLPLYFDLLWAAYRKVPLRSYKVFYQLE